MIEIAAAAIGAALTAAAMWAGNASSRSRDGRDHVVRLTVAVETVATRLEEIHVDMKADKQQMYELLSGLDRRVTRLEAKE
jgi:hypothetical protein